MSFADLERQVLAEAKTFFKNPKLTKPKILEWSTGKVEAVRDDEIVEQLPELKVNICIQKIHDKR